MTQYNPVYVVAVAMHPATFAEQSLRLEEMVHNTARQALDNCGVSRRQLDNIVLGASDELDGRPISSMLLTGPAGGYLTDEIRVTDSGLSALCLGFARIRSGEYDATLVASWNKVSKTDTQTVMRYRGDPIYMRPLGFDGTMADAMFAQAIEHQHDVSADEVNGRMQAAAERAKLNERGLGTAVPSRDDIAASPFVATPLREGQIATPSDGAVVLVLCSERFLQANPGCKPLAKMTGAGWASDSYRMDAGRLGALNSAKTAWDMAMRQAELTDASSLDVIELDSPTGWHEAAFVRAFGITDEAVISPSGGTSAQNPFFCSGLINAAEAVLQVSGTAGAVQREGVRRAAAHGCHGYAQQGNVITIFEQVKE